MAARILHFLKQLRGSKPGYFRFSWSGDLYGEKDSWGLDASVFAAKIVYMIAPWNQRLFTGLDGDWQIGGGMIAWANFIKSFGNENGEIYDPLIIRKGHWFWQKERIEADKRAETRQAVAALECLGAKPDYKYRLLPQSEADIDDYFNQLDWRNNPWDAGAQVSHLLFFLSRQSTNDVGRHYILEQLEKLQTVEDGSWHRNSALSNNQKVNAAMKIITGLAAAGQLEFPHPEKLIDLCLAEARDNEACSLIDRIYVLYHAHQLAPNYRKEKIMDFCGRRWEFYLKNLRPEGGWPFYPDRAQDRIYGAKITKGLNEPDIHGTVLGLWGLLLCGKILGKEEARDWQSPLT